MEMPYTVSKKTDAMGGEDRVQEIQRQNGGPLRLLGYLKDNKRVAYVLAIMVMLHLSNQYDRQEIIR